MQILRFLTFGGLLAMGVGLSANGQQRVVLTLDEVIARAQVYSLDAMVAQNTFLGNDWSFRSYKAELLPSLNFSANVGNFNRSMEPMQNPETGEINYRLNNNMTNSGTLSIDQNIALTGGTLSFSSSLNRLDQYSPNRRITWTSRPMTLRYTQPLWTYNGLKWDKQIEPERYEQARIGYIESMEEITIKAARFFFNLLQARMSYDIAVNNYANMKTMYGIASRRFEETGTVTHSELLQLELRMVNDSLSISNQDKQYQANMMSLRSFLGYNDDTRIELIPVTGVPDVVLNDEFVIDRALENSTFRIGQRISRLDAERAVEQAKANRGMSLSLSAQFGLESNSSERLQGVYSNLENYQVVGLSFRMPLIDWGLGKGRVQMAEAQRKTTEFRLEQALNDYIQSIYLDVLTFNTQREQFRMTRRANDIAIQRYELILSDFAAGTVSVTDLNTAQAEKESANLKYFSEISNYWINYFQIRRLSLYDFINHTDIPVEFDKSFLNTKTSH
jgi:outer membrane protein TolC